ncbi:hypothetical protein [Bradyrhizobium sp. AS23.2]|uniref:hypothetical protein n=1 Tax=Bradyrhizobium sp. AS23.2 TaxID=1680155 RepID=UPI00093E355A|nr:hypothetical protein [Bradyrhizobium sp. AS23.2]OKO84568.1 hypothetical protein AC630_08685 [Bradyrhizobium sp. AS23.2]
MNAIRNMLDSFWGRGDASITIPSMDGALRPNDLLDQAIEVQVVQQPDNLTEYQGGLLYSSGNKIFQMNMEASAETPPRYEMPNDVSCLASHPSGILAIGTTAGILLRGSKHEGTTISRLSGRPLACPTALVFDGDNSLIVCIGSDRLSPGEWKRDLMEQGRSGSVWRIDLVGGESTCLVHGLGFPYGVQLVGSGALRVSESWSHRIIQFRPGERPRPVLADLPGYPSRIAPATDGGSWVSVFAPRRQMVEFVLRERDYRERMLREVHSDYWMAPALSSGGSFLEPIQGGTVKHLGIRKPWAPTRSYGLLVKLDASGTPVASLHSRADGKRHGVTSCLEIGGKLAFTSKGGGVIACADLNLLKDEDE